ncbi:uncharacterized protein LOC107003387 isoform X2 [Solanum pennellii]|nr:uncharacterized protein LOC107003387 isoform X2 [Solanum pennellii]XP_027769024.1 uncharacterized protein LOC107003387 isoform X2 [Solanum pennellii]XP_027769025.1 uncharacterized protein LOC107003387 isoform X2 [Solanum pennellii]
MKKVDSKMAYSEQKANKVIESLGNRIGFILSYSGAWIFYEHIHLSCAIAGLITFVSLLSLFGGLAIAIWAAREELKRMIPAIENLDQEEKQLVKEVKVIKTKEEARKTNPEGMVNNDRLHAEVQCDAVVSRCDMIVNSKNYMCRFERYNRLFIWAAICCVIFNGACICCVAYFTYCRVAALRCTNPMMPLPGESAHMFNNDVIQNVPATIVDNASEFRYQVSLGDGVPQLCPVASISSVELAPHFVPVLAPTMEGGPCSSSFDSEFLHPEFCSETVAEEAHNGAGPEKEATQNALVFTAVKPQLFVKAAKAKDAVQFYKHAFGAEEVGRVNHPKRKVEQETPLILSVELKIGSSIFVVSDLTDEDSTAPVKTALTGYVFYLETVDVSSATAKAIAAGAIAEIKAEDGGADGGQVGVKLIDPYGNVWLVCSPVKESE